MVSPSVSSDPAAPAPSRPAAAGSTAAPTAVDLVTRPDHPTKHPALRVPDRLFDDEAREQRWRSRFSAVRTSLPSPARDDDDRACFVSNATGRYEVSCWDVVSGTVTVATDRPDGTISATLSADGHRLWWFDDTEGDEFGSWQQQDFGRGPGSQVPALPDVPPGYSAGLEVGRDVVVAGFSDDDGSRVHLRAGDGPVELVYANVQDAGVGALSEDETIWVLSHSELGDSRYPSLRAFRVADGQVLGELSDGVDKGLSAIAFSPIAGDQRLLVGHERSGRDGLLIWDLATGAVDELTVDLPGDLDADFYPDGRSLLLEHSAAGRAELYRYDLTDGTLTALPAARGVVSGALARRDGSVWYRWSSAVSPAEVRVLRPDGRDEPLLPAIGEPAPPSLALQDVWVDGPGGRIHAFVAVPEEPCGAAVFLVHGGPAAEDDDSFDAGRAAWLDAGFTVVQVNYRGSTGYGSAWRDALTERIGHIELADIDAVHDHLVAAGTITAGRVAIVGHSWGGFLTLMALGTRPDRFAVGVAGVPVADYPTAYEDEMEQLRAYDRALFGGSPAEVPEKYADSSPLTFVDTVVSPVLVMAGENDPRCPIRQIENYLAALAERGREYAVYRFDAGHGSMVIAERLRQVCAEIAFVRDVLDRPAAASD